MFDIFAFKAVASELQVILPGEKVNRIYQPAPRDILISFSRPGNQGALLISVNPGNYRIHLTEEKFKQPLSPPSFCMLLRKHLENSQLQRIEVVDRERILKIHFNLGTNHYTLVCELMGRNSNIILLDGNNIIRGALKHITPSMSSLRLVSNGIDYSPPPPQNKMKPADLTFQVFRETMLRADDSEKPETPAKKLVSFFQGLGPLQADEIVYRAREQILKEDEESAIEKIWEGYLRLMALYDKGDFSSFIVERDNGKKVFTVLDLDIYRDNNKQAFASTNKMLDEFYQKKVFAEKLKQLKESLTIIVQRELKKSRLKMKRQEEDILKAKEAEVHRLYGETILAHLNLIKKKSDSVTLPDIYNQDEELTIPLDPRYTAVDNAQRHFKKYRKLQKGKVKVRERLPATRREINYLDSILYSLEMADYEQLEEIRHELTQSGYIREKPGKKEGKVPFRSKPLNLETSTGYRVMVGRNNLQNDEVTFSSAGRNDLWLHIQKLPGAHVVVKDSPFPPDDRTLEEAASLAAYFSKAVATPVATVDYTLIKHVKRAPGNKPGMAIYKNFSTIHIEPEKAHKLIDNGS